MHCSPSRPACVISKQSMCGLAPTRGAACVSGCSVLDQRYKKKDWLKHEVVKDIGASHSEGVILNYCIQTIVL